MNEPLTIPKEQQEQHAADMAADCAQISAAADDTQPLPADVDLSA